MFSTDKVGHGYLPVYMQLLAALGTDGVPRIAEIGIANGEGLAMLRALCPHADLWGVDIDPHRRHASEVVRSGATIITMSQDDPRLADQLPGTWDLIIDDASHDNTKTQLTWQHLWPKVGAGGVYVIEDWNHAGGICAQLAADLLYVFDQGRPGVVEGLNMRTVDSITYRDGLIIIRRTL